ncbi:hypothetical protein TW65_09136 [Stemphylium lycopersici]|nr:hypothetical protein TW65_09136 [Stemphylium lycopersici]
MPVPTYNAKPLSMMLLGARVLQAICMILVIGICSNFVQMIVTTGVEPPKEFVGTLSVACIATLYIMVSVGYYWSEANLGLLVMAGVDSLLLIAFIVCAVTLGKPMSFLNCYVIGKSTAEVDAQYANAFVTATVESIKNATSLGHWAGVTRSNCFQAKTVWGMTIALCILFTVSCALLPTLWYKNNMKKPAKTKWIINPPSRAVTCFLPILIATPAPHNQEQSSTSSKEKFPLGLSRYNQTKPTQPGHRMCDLYPLECATPGCTNTVPPHYIWGEACHQSSRGSTRRPMAGKPSGYCGITRMRPPHKHPTMLCAACLALPKEKKKKKDAGDEKKGQNGVPKDIKRLLN